MGLSSDGSHQRRCGQHSGRWRCFGTLIGMWGCQSRRLRPSSRRSMMPTSSCRPSALYDTERARGCVLASDRYVAHAGQEAHH